MTSPPFVISIQSQVVFGHVGNSAAVFPMQAAGLEVAAIPTAAAAARVSVTETMDDWVAHSQA